MRASPAILFLDVVDRVHYYIIDFWRPAAELLSMVKLSTESEPP